MASAPFNPFRKIRVIADILAFFGLRCNRTSYLKQVGWFASFRRLMPVDAQNHAVPWYTYSAIDFLASRLRPDMEVFEYGSGNSTLWWAARVAKVVSCEHDQEWFSRMASRMPGNVDYRQADLEPAGDYARAILHGGQKFDVVLIDGRNRIECAKNAVKAIQANGVIIWDDGERPQYREGYEHLAAHGFRRLDFSGIAPMHSSGKLTSVFYRERNCLGL